MDSRISTMRRHSAWSRHSRRSVATIALLVIAGAWVGVRGTQSRAQTEPQIDAAPIYAPAEQIRIADEAVDNAVSQCEDLHELLTESRDAADSLMSTCLVDKAEQCDAYVEALRQRTEALKEAVKFGNGERQEHEFRVVLALIEKLGEIGTRTHECLGAVGFSPFNSATSTSVSVFAPSDDPTAVAPTADWPYPRVPPPASGVF